MRLPESLGFVLLRLGILGLHSDVTHRRRAGRAMPVILTRRDQNDIAGADGALFLIGGHDAGAFGDDQDLIAGVLMELVPRTGAEIDNAEVEALTLRGIDNHLPKHLTREQRADGRFLGQIAGSDDLHHAILTAN